MTTAEQLDHAARSYVAAQDVADSLKASRAPADQRDVADAHAQAAYDRWTALDAEHAR